MPRKVSNESMERSAIMRQVILRWLQRTVDASQKMLHASFLHIKQFWEHDRNVRYNKRVEALVDVIEVMYCCSERGNRTPSEKRCLHELLLGPNSPYSIFRKMSNESIDYLFDEVDMHFSEERLILFLQGDIAKTSYIVVTGSVNMFMEKSKDVEQNLIKKYKKKRDYEISEEDCKELGVHVRKITTGNVFGDLSSTELKKTRTYAAIAEPQSLILIADREVYDRVIRQYRLSEEQLALATKLLSENVLFSHYDDAKLISLAYSLHYRELLPNTTIVQANTPVRSVIIILSGDVKAFPFDSSDKGRRLAVAMLGRGTIIGERELLKQSTRFHMTYVTANICRLFEMDAKTFQENSCTDRMRVAERFKFAERAELAREEIYLQRQSVGHRALDNLMSVDDDSDDDSVGTTTASPLGALIGHHNQPTIVSIVRHASTNPRATQRMSLMHLAEGGLNGRQAAGGEKKENGDSDAESSDASSGSGMVRASRRQSTRRSRVELEPVRLGSLRRSFKRSALLGKSTSLADLMREVDNPYAKMGTIEGLGDEAELLLKRMEAATNRGSISFGAGGGGNSTAPSPRTNGQLVVQSNAAIDDLDLLRKRDSRLVPISSQRSNFIITPKLQPDQHTYSAFGNSNGTQGLVSTLKPVDVSPLFRNPSASLLSAPIPMLGSVAKKPQSIFLAAIANPKKGSSTLHIERLLAANSKKNIQS